MQLVIPPLPTMAQTPTIPGMHGSAVRSVPPAVNSLPRVRNLVRGIAGLEKPAQNRLVVRQNEPRAIIDWNSFDIGANAWMHFDQQGNSGWSALNRIYDANPSQIYGRLTADGRIYLINQNGTLFGPSARVNVHTLIASSLKMNQDDFLLNRLAFKGDAASGTVINRGELRSEIGGGIFLIAPEVVNSGTITTPGGQSGLIAGEDVEIKTPADESRLLPFVYVNNTGTKGTAINAEDGVIDAEAGLAGLYGRVVNQQGVVRSVSAFSNNGRIELHASDSVITGENSLTAATISESEERGLGFTVEGGKVHIAGLDQEVGVRNTVTAAQRIEHHGKIEAPSGDVELSATQRVYMETGSRIEVGGEWVEQPSDNGTIEVQLNSVELKNDFGQKGGILQGETVDVNPLEGSAIGDLTGALNFESMTAKELNTKGGNITLSASAGEVILRQGAEIDFSGGGKIVKSGFANSTKLVSGNRVYDISQAPQWIVYDRILNEQVLATERFGVDKTYTGLYFGGSASVSNRLSEHVQGDDAGSLTIRARGVVLDGSIVGKATRGVFQTESKLPEIKIGNFAVQLARGTRAPRGGQLTIGGFGPFVPGAGSDLTIDEVAMVEQTATLPESFGPEDNFVDILIEDGAPRVQPLTVSGVTPYASEFSEIRYWNVTTNSFATRTQFLNPGGDRIVELNDYPLFHTSLSAETLNSAGISDLTITSNTKISVGQGVDLRLAAGGFRINENQEFRQGVPREYLDSFPSALSLTSRAIEYAGAIRMPSGNIAFEITDTVTSPFVQFPSREKSIANTDLPHRIYLANNSVLDASGDRLFNNLAGVVKQVQFGNIHGGAVTLEDGALGLAEGAVVASRSAKIAVSGGFEVDTAGVLIAGDAGLLSVKANSILLNGELEGYALVGADSGVVSLHAETVEVQRAQDMPALPMALDFDSVLPEVTRGKLLLADNRLDNTGFSDIALVSGGDLIVSADTYLRPSAIKLKSPSTVENPDLSNSLNNRVDLQPGTLDRGDGTLAVPLASIGRSSISMQAAISRLGGGASAQSLATVHLQKGAVIESAPGGGITLSGRNLDLDGSIMAPAGVVALNASGNFFPDQHRLRVGESARIFAGGILIQGDKPIVTGFAADTIAIDGGSVTLNAANNLIIENGAVIDVSGTIPTQRLIRASRSAIQPLTTAGAAGGIGLQFGRILSQNGLLIGRSHLEGIKAGELLIESQSIIETARLIIGEDASAQVDPAPNSTFIDLSRIDGFDDLTFSSLGVMAFAESGNDQDSLLNIKVDGKLTIDAPLFSADRHPSDNPLATEVRLDAGWVVVANTDSKFDDFISFDVTRLLQSELTLGNSSFAANAQWIDVVGGVAFSGYDHVAFKSATDIRLSDEKYNSTAIGSRRIAWLGKLQSPANLSLSAARIYPTTLTDYSITSASQSGRITILQPQSDVEPSGPINSAGGSLTIAANEIDHGGYLAAPAGRIVLSGIDPALGSKAVIVLADNSVTTTRATMPVSLGELSDIFWTAPTKPKEPVLPGNVFDTDIESAPEKTISLQADTLVVKTGALIDASGGGDVFGYEFVPGADGLVDPFINDGRYVILPGFTQPGRQVFLPEGAAGLPAGRYSLLPEAFAFVSGAYVIEDLGETFEPFAQQQSTEGYAVVAGFEAEFGNQVQSSIPKRFAVRTAQDVFSEGNFNLRALAAGEGGQVQLLGNTTVLDGTVRGEALSGFDGGAFAVSGTSSAVVRAAESIPDDVDSFDAIIEFLAQEGQNLVGKSNIRAAGVSDKGLNELVIGTLDDDTPTDTVLVESQAELLTPVITLAGRQRIELEPGSAVYALGQGGTANLLSPDITVAADQQFGPALVRASDTVNIETNVNPDPDTVPRLSIQGMIMADNSQLQLAADNIMVVADALMPTVLNTGGVNELVLSDSLAGFDGFDQVQLTALSGLSFMGNVDFTVEQRLDIIAANISGKLADGESAAIRSTIIDLRSNRSDELSLSTSTGSNRNIRFEANQINLGPGSNVFNDFDTVSLAAGSDLTLMGQGNLLTDADLDLTAARITLAPFTRKNVDGSLYYQAADYKMRSGRFTLANSKGHSGQNLNPGGRLTINAQTIDIAGRIEAASIHIELNASGSILLAETARIAARGGVKRDSFQGEPLFQVHRAGSITVRSESGDIHINPAAQLDVSNTADQTILNLFDASLRDSLIDSGLLDAGEISLIAANGTVNGFGQLSGSAGPGQGGSFTLDTQRLVTSSDAGAQADFGLLNGALAEGGFNQRLNIRTREGSIVIGQNDVVAARHIRLTADSGGIDVRGILNAGGGTGGSIELYAGSPMTDSAAADAAVWLHSGSRLLASGIDGAGGYVMINAETGFVQSDAGSTIDVTGTTGGIVRFRAQRSEGATTLVNMRLFGNVAGAADITAEGVLNVTGDLSGDQLSSTDINNVLDPGTVFDITSDAFDAAIAENPNFRFIPGFDITAADVFTVADVDLTNFRYGWAYTNASGIESATGVEEAGALTIRAAGSLSLTGNLVDHPTAREALNVDVYDRFTETRSWDFNLVAGADLSSADLLRTVQTAAGLDERNIVIGTNVIYTENGQIQFAAGGDVSIGSAPTRDDERFMINRNIGYNLATFAGDVRGNVNNILTIQDGGAIQSALGDIVIAIGGDLDLDLPAGSAIRTTGIGPLNLSSPDYSDFDNGGSIALTIGGDLNSGSELQFWFDPSASQNTRHLRHWDNIYADVDGNQSWSADYGDEPNKSPSTPTAGVATMAGGDLRIMAGGNLNGQIGTFRDGDLTLIAGGDISGYFQVADGAGFFDVFGSLTSDGTDFDTSLALLHAQVNLAVQGNAALGSVFNPTFPETFNEYSDFLAPPRSNLTYSSGLNAPVTTIRVTTASGEVSLSGLFKREDTTSDYRILPPVVEIEAGGDIRISSLADFVLAPSTIGNLRLISAGGSITGLDRQDEVLSRPMVMISDLDPAEVYFSQAAELVLSGLKTPGGLLTPDFEAIDFFVPPELESSHANIHSGGSDPVQLTAANNIEELELFSPKAVQIQAGVDINGLHFIGQHLNPTDLSYIRAGRDINIFSTVIQVSSTSDPRIESTGYIFNGPGRFVVQAGNNIDLGISKGIQATGNSFNSRLDIADLDETKSALYVVAGLFQDFNEDGIEPLQNTSSFYDAYLFANKDMAEQFPDEIEQFFNGLLESGERFSELRSEGEPDKAAEVAEQTELEIIEPFFNQGQRGEGNIFMTSSQISTSGKASRALRPFDEARIESLAAYEESADLFIISGGDANIGLTAIPDPSTTIQETDSGIFTSEGGSIHIFTEGDLNVNESRVMTFRGGNVLAYASLGDINAGRGSKTAINAGSPRVVNILDDEGNIIGKRLEFEPPSVGSGIRTLTYDPDGLLGPQIAPLAGDGFLFAPKGTIDAGEAGISTRNLTVGATEVLNVQNIEVGGLSVGVPQTTSSLNIGSLSGTGSLSQATQLAEEAASLAASKEAMNASVDQLSDSIQIRWLRVEFVGFENQDSSDGND